MIDFPICPDCGEEIVATMCRTDEDGDSHPAEPVSDEGVAALRELLVAAHRRIAHPDLSSTDLSSAADTPASTTLGPDSEDARP